MYRYYKCSVALPHGSVGCLQCVIVVFLVNLAYFFSLKSDCLSAPKIAIGVENDMSQIFLKVCVFLAYGH